MSRLFRWLCAITAVLVGSAPVQSLGGAAQPAARYIRLSFLELGLYADVVAAGEIVALQPGTFDLAVDLVAVGDPDLRLLHVRQFKNWTCASRWTAYAQGQRVLVFLQRRGEEFVILGAGGEGEMPLVGDSVAARGYKVHGYSQMVHQDAGASVYGSLVPLAELSEALATFRRAFRWEILRDDWNERGQARDLAYRDDAEALRLRESSLVGRFLWESAVTSKIWAERNAPRPSTVRLEATPRSSAGPARIAPATAPALGASARFGHGCAYIGDVDGNGFEDLAVGAPGDERLGYRHGSLWILRMGADGRLDGWTEISEAASKIAQSGGCRELGTAVTPLGDLDRDGGPDLAVSAPFASSRTWLEGGVRVLFLDRAGDVKRSVELARDPIVAKAGVVGRYALGSALACLGDLDRDRSPELAIGCIAGDVKSRDEGPCILVVSLHGSGLVRWARKLALRDAGIDLGATRSIALAGLGDLDGDGVPDLALARADDAESCATSGVVWTVTLAEDATPRRARALCAGGAESREGFARSLAAAGDLDGDGVPDLVVGGARGLSVLLLARDGTVRHETTWTTPEGSAGVNLASTACGLLEETQAVALAAGGSAADTGSAADGGVWLLRVGADGAVSSQ